MNMKKKKVSLFLNKEVISQLDKTQASAIKGGELFTTIVGSNCNNSNPAQHQCCTGEPTVSGACVSITTISDSTPGVCAGC